MNITQIAADLAARVPAMTQDSPINNAMLIGRLLLESNDDPVLDGTPHAHPAYWRGHDDGCFSLAEVLTALLDGTNDGQGTMSSPKLETLKRKILALRQGSPTYQFPPMTKTQ